MAITEVKKLATVKDGDHDFVASIVEINGAKTLGIRRWKNRGEGYIGPTKMGVNVSAKVLAKLIDANIFAKGLKEISNGKEAPESNVKTRKKAKKEVEA